MKIFIDTSAFLALLAQDQNIHLTAKKTLSELQKEHTIFFTSSFVLSETYTRIIYDLNITIAEKFHQMIVTGEKVGFMQVFWIDQILDPEIYNFYRKFSEHKFSYTDASSYLLVKKFRLDGIFTFDKSFKKVGLSVNP
jgi:predicted nucleic acid-binding protein